MIQPPYDLKCNDRKAVLHNLGFTRLESMIVDVLYREVLIVLTIAKISDARSGKGVTCF